MATASAIRLGCVALLLLASGNSLLAESFLIDDFSEGELSLPLPAGVRFDEVSQQAVSLGPIVINGRKWTDVWSGIRDETQSATLSVDTADGVFRVDTPGDPFTYFTLSYDLFGGFEFFRAVPFDANAASVDRIRLRFRGDSARVFHSLTLTSEVADESISLRQSFGGRFVSIPGGVLEVPFESFSDDTAFFGSLTGLSIASSRYQGEFELDAIELAGAPLEGDLNRDGLLNNADLEYWRRSFGGIPPQPAGFGGVRFHTADANGDGQIDAADYTVWRDAYAATLSVAAAIPEPASAMILGIGVLAMHSRWAGRSSA